MTNADDLGSTHSADDDADVDARDPKDPVPDNEVVPTNLIDTDANLPGDQPIEDDPPTLSEMKGRD